MQRSAIGVLALVGACSGSSRPATSPGAPTPSGASTVVTSAPSPAAHYAPTVLTAPFVQHDRLPGGDDLSQVWITAANDAWAIGKDRTVLHWDGRAWTIALRDPQSTPEFHGVWASRPDDVWVIGSRRARTVRGGDTIDHIDAVSEVLHWDGARWTKVPLPKLPDRIVAGIHGSAADDIWITTSSGADLHRDDRDDQSGDAVVLHWEGRRWSAVAIAGLRSTYAVWARSKTDAWLVGTTIDRSPGARNQPALWRWNGRDWRRDTELAAVKLWGDATSTFAVTNKGEVWRHARNKWTRVTPALQESVWQTSTGAPPWLRTNTALLRWRDNAWQPVQLPPGFVVKAVGSRDFEAWIVGAIDGHRAAIHDVGGVSTVLRDVTPKPIFSMSFATPDDGWAVGIVHSHITTIPSTSTVLRWDGKSWTAAPVQPAFRAAAVWAIGPGRAWVIGADGRVARGDGTTWETMDTGVDELRSVWGSHANDIWADGCGGRLVHWNGTRWRKVAIDIPSSYRGVCLSLGGTAANDVWGVATLGNVFHFDGRQWSRVKSSGLRLDQFDLRGVWAAAPDDVWFAGSISGSSAGAPVHFDGSRFTAVRVDNTLDDGDWTSDRYGRRRDTYLWAIWGRARDDIWAVGGDGSRFHFDGTAWSRVEPAQRDPRAILEVTGTPAGPVWFGAEGGGLSSLARDAALITHPRAAQTLTACNALPPPAPASWWLQGDAGCPPGAVIDGAPPPQGRRVWCRTPFGIKHGPETTFEDMGRISQQGTYLDGRRAGTWSSFSSGHLTSERGECNGLAHGRGRNWIAGGHLLIDGMFHEGEPTGKLEQWDHQGKLLGSYELPGGNGHVVWWSSHSGEKSSEGDLVDGKKHGVWTSYWGGGNKLDEGAYDRGLRTGMWTHWRPSGKREMRGMYRDGKPTGTWTYWDENGKETTVDRSW